MIQKNIGTCQTQRAVLQQKMPLRTLRLAREAGGWDLVKLEVLWDHVTLYPHMTETLKAAEILIKEDFKVMVYCSDDPIMAKRLEELRVCRHHASRGTYWLRARSAKSRGYPSHCRAGKCTGPRGCRGWNGVRCGGGHGAGLRRCAHEHRHRPSQISSENGARHETRRGSGAACVSFRAHAQEDVCRSVVTTCRVDLTDKFKQAQRLHTAGRFAEAQDLYVQVVNDNPHDAEALCLLGTLLAQGGRFDKAEVFLRRAVQENPRNSVYHCNLGVTLQNLSQLDRAKACFQRALKFDRENVDAYYNMAKLYKQLNHIDEALLNYEQVVSLDPTRFDALINMANILVDQGRLRDAINLLPESRRRQSQFGPGINQSWQHLPAYGIGGEGYPRIRLRIGVPPP